MILIINFILSTFKKGGAKFFALLLKSGINKIDIINSYKDKLITNIFINIHNGSKSTKTN